MRVRFRWWWVPVGLFLLIQAGAVATLTVQAALEDEIEVAVPGSPCGHGPLIGFGEPTHQHRD